MPTGRSAQDISHPTRPHWTRLENESLTTKGALTLLCPQSLARHPGRTLTGVDQPFGHQGLLYEPEIGSYHNRARQFDPTILRFMQRDPLSLLAMAGGGIQDGMNLYAYVRSSPLMYLDPYGESSSGDCDCRVEVLAHWSAAIAVGLACGSAAVPPITLVTGGACVAALLAYAATGLAVDQCYAACPPDPLPPPDVGDMPWEPGGVEHGCDNSEVWCTCGDYWEEIYGGSCMLASDCLDLCRCM
ncbi:MAG: RHS repeat-associated core domain-containing protein [Planctomycetes bacterium]|nr:RHS repeat-associated core domain-containing protein [Planctomycetota bacterium]